MNDPFVKAKRDLRRSDTELHRYEALILKLQDALGTEESGDALVEVAKNAKHGELAYALSQREPTQVIIQEVAELPLPTGFGEQDQLLTAMIEKAREWLRVAKVTT